MGWQIIDAVAAAHGLQVGPPTVGQTTGGTHVSGSNHYAGLARDYGRGSDAVGISRLFAPAAKAYPQVVTESYGIDGVGISHGSPFQPKNHTGDHTHVSVGAGVTLAQLESAVTAAAKGGPLPPSPEAPDSGAGAGATAGGAKVSESGLKRFFLILGGAGLMAWGLAVVGIDLGALRAVKGAARGVVKRTPVGRVATVVAGPAPAAAVAPVARTAARAAAPASSAAGRALGPWVKPNMGR